MKTQIAHAHQRAINQSEGTLKAGTQSITPQVPQSARHVGMYRGALIVLVVIAATVVALTWMGAITLAKPSKPQVYIQYMHPLPFGPGWAADYGTGQDTPVYKQTLPFGPGWAATYGRIDARPLPFGPGHAATYGVPAR